MVSHAESDPVTIKDLRYGTTDLLLLEIMTAYYPLLFFPFNFFILNEFDSDQILRLPAQHEVGVSYLKIWLVW